MLFLASETTLESAKNEDTARVKNAAWVRVPFRGQVRQIAPSIGLNSIQLTLLLTLSFDRPCDHDGPIFHHASGVELMLKQGSSFQGEVKVMILSHRQLLAILIILWSCSNDVNWVRVQLSVAVSVVYAASVTLNRNLVDCLGLRFEPEHMDDATCDTTSEEVDNSANF